MLMIDYKKFLLALANAEMSSIDLQAKSGVGRNTISKIMNGETNIRPRIIGKLAKALGVSVEEILFLE